MRPRRVPLALALAGAISAAGGCADESVEAGADRAARALLAEVEAADYRGWARVPGWEATRRSDGPHGQTVDIYVNAPLAEALAGRWGSDVRWPVGSAAVKDGFVDGALATRSLMRKDDGGWFFALFDRDDRIVAAGRDLHCVDCHAEHDRLVSPTPTSVY